MKSINFFKIFLLFSAVFFQWAFAENILLNPTYKTLTSQEIPKDLKVPPGKIVVLEFFSYGCPHCYHFNPYLEKWQAQHADILVSQSSQKNKQRSSSYVIFHQVPVTFEPNWLINSKAFHIAQALNQLKLLNGKIFEVAQNPLLGLQSDQQMRSFFLHQGVSAAAFDQAASDPKIQQQINQDKKWMQDFKIISIPTVIIIKGKHVYLISNETVPKADPELFIETLTQLTTH